MKYLVFLLILCSCIVNGTDARTSKSISVGMFGAIPDDGKNDADALAAAAAYCRSHSGTKLTFMPGIYDVENELAERIEREAISGAYGHGGRDVQNRLFHHDAPYVKAFDLSGSHNLTVIGYGATVKLHGWYEPVSVVKAKNVLLEGLAITYNRPPSTVGRISNSTAEYFDVTIDPVRFCYLDSIVTGRILFVNAKTERMYFADILKMELLSKSVIRMYSKANPPIDDYCIIRHGGHYRPAVMIKESDDVTIKNMKIF